MMNTPKQLACILLLASSTQALGDQNQALIDQARMAAPSMVSAEATIVYQGKVLHQGTNGWTCMPETLPGDNSPICNDPTWMQMLQAVGSKAPFETQGLGFSYMLGGDGGVSNSDPYHPDHRSAKDFIKEGPHLMLIVPRAALEGITDDPHAGGPYVMWRDTPYAHIMIPVGARD
ncbi:hypothetical protein [Aestuariirhabdus litorea]|uniref:Uncharacterized protein n=1 Tax=Aestuariirhabdus litorea TaxID=2528527 RepID=A0A3P3VHS0_9GAMM|nr:hypothetical protein [Aestuariirhabdus litorea]RRJ82275.1 hypothetical protein D0544_10330 [Aestuariirhabdus litorea]RWW92441.1 hypothetical protein DZC74_10310 [Endozoicomonadaceae bacterium GTF-13]